VLLVFFSAALFKSVLRCGGRERLATSWFNWVYSVYYVESENVCCHVCCCKTIVFDIVLISRICAVTDVVVRALHVCDYVCRYSCPALCCGFVIVV